MKWLRLIAAMLLVACTTVSLAACNTVRGMGQDVESGGEAIQEGSEEVQEDI